MEIKLNAGDKITIPENCKATIKDNQIIIEEQKEFKEGDILHSKITDIVVIFSHYTRDDKHIFGSYFDSINNDPNTDWFTEKFRLATEKEKQAFFDELKAKGLRWNAETKTMEKIRKRAEKGREYLIVNRLGDVVKLVDEHSTFDDMNYNLGNYFLPEEIEEAELAAKFIRAIFEKRLKI